VIEVLSVGKASPLQPPWSVEDFRVIPYDGWNGHVTGAV
jgi:hypothetical protein